LVGGYVLNDGRLSWQHETRGDRFRNGDALYQKLPVVKETDASGNTVEGERPHHRQSCNSFSLRGGPYHFLCQKLFQRSIIDLRRGAVSRI
jgi:hypothetical protein